ncbi:hypothetical protein AAG906_031744 [Vitis piasezkii]
MQLLCLMPTCRSMNHACPPSKAKTGEVPLKGLAPPLMAAVVALSPICNTPGNPPICFHCSNALLYCFINIFFIKHFMHKTINGVDTEEEIYRVTYYGKGRMPGFGENCTPRGQCTFGARLQEEEIKLLAEFVKGIFEKGNRKILK